MTLVRRHHTAQLRASNGAGAPVFPQSVVITYQVNTIPSARVELSFGEGFTDADTRRVRVELEQLDRWAQDRTMLQIATVVSDGDRAGNEEVVFEGYLMVPSIQLMRSGAGYAFELQHWSRDLAIGSLLLSYALPSHPGERDIAVLYQRSYLGGGSAAQQGSPGSQNTLEGIARRAGLPVDWRNRAVDDLWANVQKPFLAHLLLMEAKVDPGRLFTSCHDALNRPSSVAAAALQRIQGPTEKLGRAYQDGVVPISISRRVSGSTRQSIGTAIANAIGHTRLGHFERQTCWDQIMQFCSEFGLNFVPRSQDAAIIVSHVGSQQIHSAEINEGQVDEVAWSASQQLSLRGVGILSDFYAALGTASIQSRKSTALAHGCYLASEDPNLGQVFFQRPPSWLAGVVPDVLSGGVARSTLSRRGVHGPAAPASQNAKQEQDREPDRRENLQDLFHRYAHMRFIETDLQGRLIRVATPFRTDIAPGSVVRVNLRASEMISRLNLETESLTGMVSGLTLAMDRNRRHAVTSFEIDFGRTESQLNGDKYTLDSHPIFDNTTPGLKLVTA